MTPDDRHIKLTNLVATIFLIVLIVWHIVLLIVVVLSVLPSGTHVDWSKLLENLEKGTSVLEHLATIIALIIGGLWAYYKFFKGRIFVPRLELSISGRVIRSEGVDLIVASLQIKNVGLSQVQFKKESNLVRFLSFDVPKNKTKAQKAKWKWLKTYNVFEHHKWIEPGEAIKDQVSISIPKTKQTAFLIEFRIVGGVANRKPEIIKAQEWWESRVVEEGPEQDEWGANLTAC